jgi:TolB-like protein
VYAAGATLFEAATGKRLHDDDTLKDVAAAVLADTGDATLANAIARAVKERVADRFEDGTAFARAIEGPTVTEVVPAEVRRVPRRAAFAAGVVVALGVGGAVVAMRGRDGGSGDERPGSGSVEIKKSKTIAVLPFVDSTANPLLDFASSGLPNLLGLELHEVPGVTVVGYYQLLGHVAGSTAPIAAFREAAVKIGADVIVRGELTAKGERVHVAIRVENAAGDVLDTIEQDATVEQVPETVRTAAGQVARAMVGLQGNVGGTRAPTAFAADRELQLGIAALEREKLPEAITHLRAAVHHAPDLKLAHYYLAVALYWNAPPTQPARDEIDQALALGLDEAQKGFLAGIRHIAEQDYAKGIGVLRPLAERYPSNKDILYGLFEALFHGGRPLEAMSVYRRLIKLQPRFRLALVHAFTYYVSHGDDTGVDWTLALGDPAGDAYNRIWEPRVLMARRKYGEAIALLNAPLEAGAIPGSTRDLQTELVTAYVLDDKLELAQALVVKLGETNVEQTAQPRLALATARGDAAGRARWRSVAIRELARQTAGPGPAISWTMLAVADLLASKLELAST